MPDPAAATVYDPEDLLRQLRPTRGHFALESGYHGDLRLDLDRALGSPHVLAPAIDELARRIAELEPHVVCGPLTGGAFLAFAVAEMLSLRFCWSTRTPRGAPSELYPYAYEAGGDLQGLTGTRVVIVDDAINAGSATRATLADLRRRGTSVVAAAALLTVGRGAHDLSSDADIALIALAELESNLWRPEDCPHCPRGESPTDIA